MKPKPLPFHAKPGKKLAAPRRLPAEARKLWSDLQSEYGIVDPGGLLLLGRACEAFDRLRRAQAIIRKHGEVIADARGSLKSNPAVLTERDAHKQMLDALKALNLDLEPVKPIGRPGA